MERTLTNVLITVQDDLEQIKRIREYLDSNPEEQNGCSLTWQTIEAYNSIMNAFTSSEKSETEALDTLLDSFYYLSINNKEENVWRNFGFELGVICVKILSAIEQTTMFEVFFCKFLSVLKMFSERTSDAWKPVALQILNAFINKNFSFHYFETGLKLYVSILRNISNLVLNNFAKQNSHLLKTFLKLTEVTGDFQVQVDIVELVLLHACSDKKLIENFFTYSKIDDRSLLLKLNFQNFEEDCRTYLNTVNKSLGVERQVFSISCHRLLLGGYRLEPPSGSKTIWLDANASSERLTTKCVDFQTGSPIQLVIYVQFVDVKTVEVEQQSKNCFRIVIKAKNLKKIHKLAKTEEIVCITASAHDSEKEAFEFKYFIEKFLIQKAKELNTKKEKLSQTCAEIIVHRSTPPTKVANKGENSLSQSFDSSHSIDNRSLGINCIIPNAISLLNRVEQNLPSKETQLNSKLNTTELHEPKNMALKPKVVDKEKADFFEKLSSQKSSLSSKSPQNATKINQKSQDLSPNSFVESLNKNLGLDSPTIKSSFENPLEPTVSTPNETEKTNHKLYRSPNIIFDFSDLKAEPTQKKSCERKKAKTKSQKPKEPNTNKSMNSTKELYKNDKKILDVTSKLTSKNCLESGETESDKYFRGESAEKKKKPVLPKLSKSLRSQKKEDVTLTKEKKPTETNHVNKTLEIFTEEPSLRPSLLDPKGYAYQRWLRPTTSERSNFWLKKLNANKQITSSNGVFDFVDESDSEFDLVRDKKRGPKTKRKSKRIQKANKKKEKTEKQNSSIKEPLKQIGSSLKGTSSKKETKTVETNKEQHQAEEKVKEKSEYFIKDFDYFEKEEPLPQVDGGQADPTPNTPSDIEIDFKPDYDNLILKRNSSFESIEDCEYATDEKNEKSNEIESLYEDEYSADLTDADSENSGSKETLLDVTNSKKRSHSDEENSITKILKKKKYKTKYAESLLRFRLQKFEEKIKQETNEIIKIFSLATHRLINCVQKKNAEDVVNYVQKAAKTTFGLCQTDLQERTKRIQKVYLYHKTRCSVSDVYESIQSQILAVKNAMNDLVRSDVPTWKKINKFNKKLEFLIENEIEELIKREVTSFRNKMIHSASIFDVTIDDYINENSIKW